jgi:hypothetical protein
MTRPCKRSFIIEVLKAKSLHVEGEVTVHVLIPALAVQAPRGGGFLGCLKGGKSNNPRNLCNGEKYEQSIFAKVTSIDFSY